MRYLMVTTHPPTHCGIGGYGEQSAAQLRAQGNVVDILSPDGQGNVDFAWDLRGGAKVLRLTHLIRYYDRIVIQYSSDFFYRDLSKPEYLKTTLSFLWLFVRSRKIELVVHEIPYMPGRLKWIYGLKWKLAPHIVLHTNAERDRFEQHYGVRLSSRRIRFRKQEESFQRYTAHSQGVARERLGLPAGKLIFLCIGFIQRHKGFHRAMESFIRANPTGADLFVVGSLRAPDPDNQRYLGELRAKARESRNVHLVESFVSNQDFDTWIAACDWMILPYSEIWSSAVLGRAKLLGKPAIVSRVGGLPDQTDEHDLLFQTDEDLVSAFELASAKDAVRSRDA